MLKIFTDLEGIPESIQCGLFSCSDVYNFTKDPEEADFLAYPTHYQVAYDYKPSDFIQHNLNSSIQSIVLEKFRKLDSISSSSGKRIIVFYLRDPETPLPVPNGIIFRTSLSSTKRQSNEFAYPANGKAEYLSNLNQAPGNSCEIHEHPTIGFRGQAFALQLPMSLHLRIIIDRFTKYLGLPFNVGPRTNYGYLIRRNAILKLSKKQGVYSDFKITTPEDTSNPNSINEFAACLYQNVYQLVVSGHGNYSFRMLETMACARIPIFINTDCILPLEGIVDFKRCFVWVDSQEISHLASKIIDFHRSHSKLELHSLMLQNFQIWNRFLKGNNFYRHIVPILMRFK